MKKEMTKLGKIRKIACELRATKTISDVPPDWLNCYSTDRKAFLAWTWSQAQMTAS